MRRGESAFTARRAEELSRRLLAWYAREARDLPWRRRPTPYKTWISEVMLQQTTVPVAAPYFRRFVRRIPTVAALARTRDEEVLALWSGLGYYHRAHNLLAAARAMVARHGGRVPSDLDSLRALPGIGAYTAGAIRSIGFNLPAVALEANSTRVLARLGAVRGDTSTARTRGKLEDIAATLMPEEHPSAFLQALMDLGASLCSPREPQCGACPVSRYCGARAAGLTERIPMQRRKEEAIRVTMDALAILREPAAGRSECMLVRRGNGPLMKGMWEFPMAVSGSTAAPRTRLATGGEANGGAPALASRYGARALEQVGEVPHTITRHRIRVSVFTGRVAARGPQGGLDGARGSRVPGSLRAESPVRWAALDALAAGSDGLASSAVARKIARLLKRQMSARKERAHA